MASAFETDAEARSLILERIGRFGSLMIEPMERVYRAAEDRDVELMSASALMYLGSDIGVPSLMGAIEVGNPNLCLAAITLSTAEVPEAAALIEDVLLEYDLSDTLVVECLVSSLRRLKHPMPESVRLRLSAIEPQWLRDSLLN